MNRFADREEGGGADVPGVVSLATTPAEPRHKRRATAIFVLLLLPFVALAPFAAHRLPHVLPFLPLYQSALITSELITAVVLLGQFRILRSEAMLILASGYLFSSLMAVPHLLTFPGLFSHRGLLGAGEQTSAWLYVWWHGGFPLFIIGYIVASGRTRVGSDGAEIRRHLAPAMTLGVVALVCFLTYLSIAHERLLPVIVDGDVDTPSQLPAVTVSWIACLVALLMLLARRKQSLLDVALIIVMLAWLFDDALAAVLNNARFDLGWYAGRVFGLCSATGVLIMLLLDSNTLYRHVLALRERERRSSNELLRSSEQRFVATFENAPIGIGHRSPDGRWLLANAKLCQILGFTADELGARTFEDITHPDDRPTELRRRERMLAGAIASDSTEQRCVRKDGSVVWIRRTVALVRRADGTPDYLITVIEDLSERKLAEEKLRAMSKEMARLSQVEVAIQTVAALAHELNQPLAAVSAGSAGAARMVARGNWTPEKLERALRGSEQAALRAGQVVQDLVSFTSQGKVSTDPLDLNELVGEIVVKLRASHAGEASIRLEQAGGLRPVLANRLRVEKVLANLVDNGIEAMLDAGSARGEIVVSVAADGDAGMAEVTVEDGGPGLDAETMQRIFEPFFTTKSHGLGMGLAVSRAIIESHGGRLWVANRPGAGASFHFTLPFAP